MRSSKWFGAVAAMLAAVVFGGPVAAQTAKGGDDPAFIAFSAGYHDLLDNHDAFEGRLEYRHDKKFWIFKPFVGAMATHEEAVYGYAGVLVDIYLGRRWVLTPSFAPGVYRQGDGKDLGGAIEFKSQLEFSYRFDNRSRLGIGFSHMSNASIYDSNPGVETLFVTYALPLGGR
ncbi:MAG: acyloxyacyl hydrolase [Ferrovibrio sp.]|uniref:acyloxyacyl hydrolase n=1 Tax=Ferrovibrio sp. TaxID=1917215 RepID=UPI00391CD28C